eukprot:jgi/Antlo1/640/2495
MHTRTIEGPNVLVRILLKRPDKTKAISFENCIEIRTNNKVMPKIPLFKVIDNKMYAKTKLSRYDNVVRVVVFSFRGHVTDRTLARLLIEGLPTLFDQKTIYKMNWEFCMYQFREHIMQSSITILGREEVVAMGLMERLNACSGSFEHDPEDSSILDEISMDSEEVIAL